MTLQIEKGTRVFVSGGAGVIGSYLIEKLYALGAEIFVGDLKPRPLEWPQEIFYREGDLNEVTAEELLAFEPAYYFHLAASFERSVESYAFYEENFQHNVRLSHYLLHCLKEAPSLKKIIFASSYLIYDPALYLSSQPQQQTTRLSEKAQIAPRNLCGAAKWMHEKELAFVQHFKGKALQTVSARIFRSYGKNSRDIISRWIRTLLHNEPLTVYQKEGQFDFIYAGDVAEGLLRLAQSNVSGVINLGRDHARSIESVVSILQKYFPDSRIQEENVAACYEASQANMDEFYKEVGWKPESQLEETIPLMIAFEKKYGA